MSELTKPIFLAGKFIQTENELGVYSPYHGKLIGKTWLAGKSELEQAIESGLNAEKTLRELPVYKRFDILNSISKKILERKNELAIQLAAESGKPLKYAIGEIDRSAQTFLVAAEEAKRLPGEFLSIDWTPAGEGKEAWVKYFPVGLIAGIAPFNFPMNLAVHKIAPAIAAGNPIIVKPARSTPFSLLSLAEIISETDLPKGAISILPMDRESGNQLVTDPRFKMLSFTGSPAVGWKMKSLAGKKKVLLELGGNAGLIVSDSANIDLAVSKALVGSFAYSGQVCIHVQRIFVQEKVFDEFISRFIKGTNRLVVGSPDKMETDISAMIDEENAKRVEAWVNDAVDNGARILSGGKREGSLYPPTILTNTQQEMKVCALEVFGPVVSIEKYKNFDDAIQQINNSEYGLQAGVFTDRLSEMNRAFMDLEVGGVIINDVPTFRVDHMPYGGVKNSGFGREGIKYSIQEMMEARLLVKNII